MVRDDFEDVPEELTDEKGKVKIGVAAGISAVIIGGFIGVLTGVVPADNVGAKEVTTLFVALAGIVSWFLFKKLTA